MLRRCPACIALFALFAACQQSPSAQQAVTGSLAPQSPWRALPAPLPQGYRGVAFDQTRGVYWILSTERDGSVGHVMLQRFDPSIDAWFATSVSLDAGGFVKGLVQVALDGGVWLGWGRTLAKYDPVTDTTESWRLPADSAGVWSTDGDMVALIQSDSGEIWTATEPVHAVFGFDPGTCRWNRTISLPFEATAWSRFTQPAPGRLLINGVFVRGSTATSHLASINTSSGAVTQLPPDTRDYVTNGRSMVYVDDSNSVRSFNLDTGADTLVAETVPVFWPDALALDSAGGLWLSVFGVRLLGVGHLNLETGSLTKYALPYIDRPGRRLASPAECAGQFHCIPSDAIAGTQVQSIEVDRTGTLWVFTDMGGTTTDFTQGPAPLYEFKPPA